MNRFMTNLKEYVQENPIIAIGIGVAAVTAVAKLIDASGHAVGSRAYAKQVNARHK